VDREKLLIVDFKTNRPPPRSPSEVAPAYLRQMALYKALLSEVYPGREVRCGLLWTQEARLMTADPSLLNT
jgi:ATP-dependent helicase/nuclease subunit A